MNRLALALLSLGLVGSAQAQTNFNMPPPGGVMVIGVQVVATCGVGTLSTTTPGFVTMNQLGQLCTNASGGGGGSVTQGTVPWVDSVHYWGSSDTALGAPSVYGTAPGAVNVPGVNAFVTNATAPGQATPPNSLPVVQAGLQYETVAASQTGQVMGGSGATGDYLSHCVVYPTSTSPGVVTVFDNASAAGTNVIAFAGGSSSISNLVPFSFPVGAFSVAGPWKITTGANLVVTCYGKFT